MSGGVLGERGPDKKHIFMSVGYVDPFLITPGIEPFIFFVCTIILKIVITICTVLPMT